MVSSVQPSAARLRPDARRRSIGAAYANGAIWGLSAGLASTTLITYLAKEYGASGVAISWLLAAPALVGLLRLSTPYWLERVPSRRSFCAAMFSISGILLCALPVGSAPGVLSTPRASVTVLVVLWVAYKLAEYIGAVTLWSWFGDVVPEPIRGRFVGRRQAWMNAGKVIGIVITAVGTHLWMNYCDEIEQPDLKWRAYAVCSIASAVLVLLSVGPLFLMADLPVRREASVRQSDLLTQLLRPIFDRKFRRLLWFGLWFSFSNGITQSARFVFMAYELNISYATKRTLDASSRGVQSLLMPWVGNEVDRRGNVPILAMSQAIIAAAPLFLLMATLENWWWVLGAYVCWIAYAGENVTQPNLMLALSDPDERSAYASAWFAWTQLAYALSVLAGGYLFDWLKEHSVALSLRSLTINHFALLFLASWMLKTIGVYWAARIRE